MGWTDDVRGTADRPIVLTVTEARRHFGALLERTNHGEHFLVTKRGVPVVRITPLKDVRADGAPVP